MAAVDPATPASEQTPPPVPPTPPTTPPAPTGQPPATPPATPPPTTPPATPPEPPKAPEKYELKAPEGGRVDESDLKRIEVLARANAWSNDDAQAAINEFDTQIKAQSEAFLTETKADATYGGAQLEESQRLAKQAIARIRPDGHPRRESFLRFLNRGGAGNHLEVVAFLADLGKLMAEDKPAPGASGDGAKEYNSPLDLYKHTTPTM